MVGHRVKRAKNLDFGELSVYRVFFTIKLSVQSQSEGMYIDAELHSCSYLDSNYTSAVKI